MTTAERARVRELAHRARIAALARNQAMRKARTDGASIRDLCRATGMHNATVRRILDQRPT